LSVALAKDVLGLVTRYVVHRSLGSRSYDGIRLLAYPPHGTESLNDVVEGLDLLREIDPRRFQRVKRCVKEIVVANWSVKIAGVYKPINRVCLLTKLPDLKDDRFALAYAYASIIVHEATHGVLEEKRFPYSKVNKDRIEHLCHKEQERFMERLSRRDRNKWQVFRAYAASLICRGDQPFAAK
jgi:hypothetical protein